MTDLEQYSDHAWILRYRKERDNALKAHQKQYRRRQFLARFGLARAPEGDAFERFIDIDREKEREQEERKGWVKRRAKPAPIVVSKTSKILGKGEKNKKKNSKR